MKATSFRKPGCPDDYMYFWLLTVLQVIMMPEKKIGWMIKILEVICCKLGAW